MEPISLVTLPARRFFALLGLHGQGERGSEWQTLNAEEYFAILGGMVPRMNRNRAPCSEQRQTLSEMFSGFVWE